jgi:hypothetical protein
LGDSGFLTHKKIGMKNRFRAFPIKKISDYQLTWTLRFVFIHEKKGKRKGDVDEKETFIYKGVEFMYAIDEAHEFL